VTEETYTMLEAYMRRCAGDSAHDEEHVLRVLYNALRIAEGEEGVDHDVLITACLLHDIGRPEQFRDPELCHARVGSEKAFRFLTEAGFGEEFSRHVSACILTHRFRKAREPESVEAKILFDADKLDVTGALGIARTLMYKGNMTEPIYTRLPSGQISDGTAEGPASFFREYKLKLERLYDRFYTKTGASLGRERRAIAAAFYENLFREVNDGDTGGRQLLAQRLREEADGPTAP